MQTLSGRTCVFAGATAGDGVDAVKALCEGGMNVILMTHQRERARNLVQEIERMGYPGKCIIQECSKESGIPAEQDPEVYQNLMQIVPSIDVIISNTGSVGKDIPMEMVEESELIKNVDHLLGGAFSTLKAALPFLKESRAARVIFMTSVEGVCGGVHESFSNAVAKGAVHSLTLNAAARLASQGITVNCIAKGPIPRVEGMEEGDVDVNKMQSVVPMGRLGTPRDLANAICFFASEESEFITGQTMFVSGGMELRP